MDVAERFRDLRTKAGMTKTALAKPRFTVSYVSQIESGRRTPSADAMGFFAERLGVTPRFLSTGIPDGLEDSLGYRLEEARKAIREGRLDEAEAELREVLGEAERYGLGRLRAQSLAGLGDALALQGRFREAIDKVEEGLEEDLLPEREAGMAVSRLARTYRIVGDLQYAAEVIDGFLTRKDRPPHDMGTLAELQAVLISIYFERGDIHRAERAARRALAAADAGVPNEIRANVYWDASRVFAEARQWDEALDYATRARILLEELDDRRSLARLHISYAFICLEAEPPRTAVAREHLDLAEAWLPPVEAARELAYVHEERARLLLLEDRPEEAVTSAERALVGVGEDELQRARALFVRGRALTAMERPAEARLSLQHAADLFDKHGARQQLANAYREIGELDLAEGHVQDAVEALRAGLAALDPHRSRAS